MSKLSTSRVRRSIGPCRVNLTATMPPSAAGEPEAFALNCSQRVGQFRILMPLGSSFPSSTKPILRLAALCVVATPLLAGCGGLSSGIVNTKEKFSSAEYGVAASRRVTTSKNIPKGGGRYQVGKPYQVAGHWYKPQHDPHYDQTGAASWYGPNFHGRETANGEIFDQYAISAAHPTLPLPSYARVTNLSNGRSIVVRVNDRGPFVNGRIIDLSRRTAELLDYQGRGTTKVRVQYVGPAPLEGDDTRTLMASLNGPDPSRLGDYGATTRVASAGTSRGRSDPGGLVGATMRAAWSGIDMLETTFSIFNSYAPETPDAGSQTPALAAANAMAGVSPELQAWQQANDMNARKVDIELGVYRSPETISKLSIAFALLGAVQKDSIEVRGSAATRIRLTYLKQGVTRADVVELAEQFGIKDINSQ
jgi:rare lipoprotein A